MTTHARDTGGDHLVSRVFFFPAARVPKRVPSGGFWLSAKRILAILLACVAASAAAAAGVDPSATINGQRLEVWEVERELAVRISVGSYHRRVSAERKAELRCASLGVLVLKELKRQWAESNPVVLDPEAEQLAWQEVRDRFKSDEQYGAALRSKGIAEDAFRLAFHRDAVADAVDAALLSSLNPPGDDEVEVYFILHGADYVSPEARHVVHILVYVPPSAPREKWQEAEQRAGELAGEARDGDSSLLELGGPMLEALPPRFRDQVGDVGFVHRGSLQSDVDPAVFSAEVGEVIDPILSIYGYHVLQVISARPPQPMDFAAVRDVVEERMMRELRQRTIKEFERELTDSAVIEVGECVESF